MTPVSPSWIILAAAAIGLVANTMAVLGVAWKGGQVLGQMQESLKAFTGDVEQLSVEVHRLGESVTGNTATIARTVAQLDGIEQRVSRLEDQQDQAPHRGRKP